MLSKEESYVSQSWVSFKEPIGVWDGNSFTAEGILEHLNVTKDISDYLWYVTRYVYRLFCHFYPTQLSYHSN